MGLNTLFFAGFYVAVLWYLYPESRQTRGFWFTAGGNILTAAMVVWHNSDAAKFAFWISAMCAAGFAQEPAMRQILRACLHYLAGLWQTPRHFLEALNTGADPNAPKKRNIGKAIGMTVVPLLVVSVFYFLYYAANDKFAALADHFWEQVGRVFTLDISIPHLLFVLFGFFLVGAAFWRNQTSLAADDLSAPDVLLHQRPPRKRYIESVRMFGLKREYQQSVLLLWMLNVLLLIVNTTDVWYVWFGFDEDALQDLKSYVHEGTYFLIASILLAMGVLFYVFRKNLNFIPNNQSLRLAAAIWLAQNALLAISVGVRNSRYIDYHGLAYKRIGVILFLILVFIGLFTLFLKIRDRKTKAWLWRQNSWAFYALLLLNACIAWDPFITRYNLSGAPKGAVDVHFMIYGMSDKNIFLLEQNIEKLPQLNMYPKMEASEIRTGIEYKRQYFEKTMQQYTWKSWNLGDLANAR